jgi:glucose-6-phosphate 1-dehydrogenase
MVGDGALFTREDAVEAAWAIVDGVLKDHNPVFAYDRHTWGPKEADLLFPSGERRHKPAAADASK